MFIYIEKEPHQDIKVFIASKSLLDHFHRRAGKTFRESTRTSRVASNNVSTKSSKMKVAVCYGYLMMIKLGAEMEEDEEMQEEKKGRECIIRKMLIVYILAS